MMVASFQYSAVKFPALAATPGNVMGWLWADPIGWTSVNSVNTGACSPGPCGSYGVNVDPVTLSINGFAWNDDAGWICFGDSCTVAACNTSPPGAMEAHMNAISGVTEVHGWANVCNESGAGWISLNCNEPGACGLSSYKVQYDSTTKKFTPNVPPPYTSLAWNGNTLGTGFGYFDFSRVTLNTLPENDPTYGPNPCKDGSDNDLNGLTNCMDPACQATPTCAQDPSNTDYFGNNACNNGIADNGSGLIDCADPGCATAPNCVQAPGNVYYIRPGYGLPPTATISTCGDGINNDGTGIDCASPGCSGYIGPPGSSCGVLPPIGTEAACGLAGETNPPGGPPNPPKTAQMCCTDGLDNDANGKTDCDETSCQNTVPQCVPAWLQTKFGNIYAQSGLSAATSSLIVGKSATYCLSTQGEISGFSSNSGCTESGIEGQPIVLPKVGQNYKGTLGMLDINGIKSGRYGKVIPITGSFTSGAPLLLNGSVYHVTVNTILNLSNPSFSNGTLQTDRGNGLLFVEGGDLTITGNVTYASLTGLSYLRNLASFGVIVTKDSAGNGGNIIIAPGVTNLVGTYFAEESISTGTTCPMATSCPADVPLNVAGMFASHMINLQRNYRDPNIPAEVVNFDGRSVANPPPGMADIVKSLPTSKDAY